MERRERMDAEQPWGWVLGCLLVALRSVSAFSYLTLYTKKLNPFKLQLPDFQPLASRKLCLMGGTHGRLQMGVSLLVPFPMRGSSCKVHCALIVMAWVEMAPVVSVVPGWRPGVTSVSSQWLSMVHAGHQGFQRRQQNLACQQTPSSGFW